MKKTKLDLVLPEYEKIFRILHSLHSFANENDPPSCQFYNLTGALILNKIYGIKARPMWGAAFIKVDDKTNNAIAFAHPDFNKCNSDTEHFHCWIETLDHFIDFTSPVYNDYPNSPGISRRLMFQRPHESMSPSHMELDKAGDFYFRPNVELAKQQLASGLESTKLKDFAEIALYWADLSKKTLQKTMTIKADDGEVINLSASSLSLTGSW